MTVSSGKGGVGKTNITVNLALALRLLGKKVMAMDSDLGLGDINLLLGRSPSWGIKNFLNGEKSLADVLYEGPGGISVLPTDFDLNLDINLNENQKAVFLNELNVIGETTDFFLIDTGTGISSNVIFFNLIANDSIVITTPEPTSIAGASSLIRVVGMKNPKKYFLILVNLARDEAEAKEAFRKLCRAVDQKSVFLAMGYLGYIPYDEYLPMAVRNQNVVLASFPEAASSRKIVEIARTLIGRSKQRSFLEEMRMGSGGFRPEGN